MENIPKPNLKGKCGINSNLMSAVAATKVPPKHSKTLIYLHISFLNQNRGAHKPKLRSFSSTRPLSVPKSRRTYAKLMYLAYFKLELKLSSSFLAGRLYLERFFGAALNLLGKEFPTIVASANGVVIRNGSLSV